MTRPTPSVSEQLPPEDADAAAEFEVLLAHLKQSRGFDFTAYKRASLMRRVQVRMQTLGVKRFAAYLDFLQVDPEEFTRLFNTILINVTSFFRDPANWEYLRDEILPGLATHGIRMLPVVEPDGRVTGQQIITYALMLVPVSLLPAILGISGRVYLVAALVLGLLFLASSIRAAISKSNQHARQLLLASVLYLPLLFGVMVLNR